MSDEESKASRRSQRLKTSQSKVPPKSSLKRKNEDPVEDSDETLSEEESTSKKSHKKQKTDNKENVKKRRQPKSSKPKKDDEIVEKQMEMDELDEFADLPELNAPQEWMSLLENGPSTSKHISPTKHTEMTEDQSSDDECDDFHEVDVPKAQSTKNTVEVHVEKKKSEAVQEMEKFLRQEIERARRQHQEDSHKLHFYVYLCHLRYQMLRAKEFCQKYKDDLSDLVDFELFNPVDESRLIEFHDRFNKGELPAETTKDSLLKRLHSILKTSIFQSDKDLAMAFLIMFLANEFKCRLCIGFTPKPDLPSTTTAKTSKKKNPNKSTNDKSTNIPDTTNFWVEYFDETENEWIAVHPMIKNLCNAAEIEKYRSFSYALGIDNDINVFDLSGWYVEDFLKKDFRKTRLPDSWIESVLLLHGFCSSKKRAIQEAKRLESFLLSKPLPTIINEYKNHPLYVLEKDLLKFEAIYPKDIKPLGQIRKQNVYPRSSVVTLQGELNWIREARSVKEGEQPYKVVKARPKLSVPVDQRVPLFLNTYGYWQTEPYVRPKVVDGKIPRNEYGNVYMYKPEMVPVGCVHLKERGVLQMAKMLELQAVPAVVDWEFSGGRNHPVIDGCVVLRKDAKVLRNACVEYQQIRDQKKARATEERALQLWRRLIKGKLLLRKMKQRFNVTD